MSVIRYRHLRSRCLTHEIFFPCITFEAGPHTPLSVVDQSAVSTAVVIVVVVPLGEIDGGSVGPGPADGAVIPGQTDPGVLTIAASAGDVFSDKGVQVEIVYGHHFGTRVDSATDIGDLVPVKLVVGSAPVAHAFEPFPAFRAAGSGGSDEGGQQRQMQSPGHGD